MKLVGAGLGKHVDDATGKTSILRIVAVGLDSEFLDGIRVGQDVAGVSQVGHVDCRRPGSSSLNRCRRRCRR